MVLLHAVHKVWSGELVAVHVNHQMRDDAHKDEAHCIELGKQWGIPVEVVRVRVPKHNSAQHQARQRRYDVLADLADQKQATVILTGHHEADLFESVLLKIARGTSTSALGGMQSPWQPHPSKAHLMLARPLRSCSREAIDHYAEVHALRWIEDSSNTSDDYRRNELRHHVIPRWLPDQATRQGVRRTMLNWQDEQEALSRWCDEVVTCAVFNGRDIWQRRVVASRLEALPRAIIVGVLQRVLRQMDQTLSITTEQAQEVVAQIQARATFDQQLSGVRIQSDGHLLTVTQTQDRGILRKEKIVAKRFGQDQVRWFEFLIEHRPAKQSEPIQQKVWKWWTTQQTVCVRPINQGERWLRHDGRMMKVKDSLRQLAVPVALRSNYPCFVDQNDQIVWIPGCRPGLLAQAEQKDEASWFCVEIVKVVAHGK